MHLTISPSRIASSVPFLTYAVAGLVALIGFARIAVACEPAPPDGGRSSAASSDRGSLTLQQVIDIDRLLAAVEASTGDVAIDNCKEVLRRDPTNVHALNVIGYWLRVAGRSKDALPYIEQACLLAPFEYQYCFNNRAAVIGESDDVTASFTAYADLAERHFAPFVIARTAVDKDADAARWSAAISSNADDAHALFRRAAIRFYDEAFTEALKDVDAAIAVRPREGLLRTARALLLSRLDRPQESAESCREAIALLPHGAFAQALLCDVLSKKVGDATTALQLSETAMNRVATLGTAGSARFDLVVDRAWLLYEKGDLVGALSHIYRAEAERGDAPRFSGFDMHDGMSELAIQAWCRNRLAANADDVVAMYLLANLLSGTRQLDESIILYTKLVGIVTVNDRARLRRGIAHLISESTNGPQAAANDFTAFIGTCPDDWYGHLRLSHALTKLNRHTESLSHRKRAAELAPWSAEAFYALGYGLWQVDQNRAAIVAFTRAMYLLRCGFARTTPEMTLSECYTVRARASLDGGLRQLAIDDLEAALTLDPNVAATSTNWISTHQALFPPRSTIVTRRMCQFCGGTGRLRTQNRILCGTCGGGGWVDDD